MGVDSPGAPHTFTLEKLQGLMLSSAPTLAFLLNSENSTPVHEKEALIPEPPICLGNCMLL